jgi:hypothetical protein
VSRARRRTGLAVVLLLLALAPAAMAAEPLPAVFHVHTRLSTGALTMADLLAQAEKDGLGAVFFAENYLLRVEYGLPPFRALTRVVREEPSVLDRREAYAREVAEARRRFPHMVIVPGVEIMPHYRWSGNPLTMAMTLHDTQKNVLVFGVDPLDLHTLPVTGNPHARVLGTQSLIDAIPVLLLVPGAMLLARRGVRRVRLGSAVVVVRRRRWLRGGLLVAIGVVALVRGWPFTVDRYPPWRDYGTEPYQVLIDEVERRGGAAVWSFPEGPDAGERSYGPVKVRWRTEAYPDDLLRTSGYTGFGAVYEQPLRFARPGEGWDRLLTHHVAGERAQPVWGVGEAGFHSGRGGKRLRPVQTVFFVEERSPAGALDALARGRMYAVRNSGEATLVLSELAVTGGGAAAGMGDTLRAAAGTPVEVRASVSSPTGSHAVRVTLVKDGKVEASWAGRTPLEVRHPDVAGVRRSYYRLDARVSSADYLVSNPVFVAP